MSYGGKIKDLILDWAIINLEAILSGHAYAALAKTPHIDHVVELEICEKIRIIEFYGQIYRVNNVE